MESGRAGVSFNVLPPGSGGEAMAIGELLGGRYEGVLPDDGDYAVRVFLSRAAARRGETADFAISVRVSGDPLVATSFDQDAPVQGTRYHARTSVSCKPVGSAARRCDAFVVRRGFEGTATVELRWAADRKRRILFVKGTPTASDSAQPMTFERDARGWRVRFGADERFEIPEELIFGG